MPNQNDPVYACLQVETLVLPGEYNTTLRAYRGTALLPGHWTKGDTILLKLQKTGTLCRLFGDESSGLGPTDVVVRTSGGTPIPCTVAGLGTCLAVITLGGPAPDGEILSIRYRVGIPGSFIEQGDGFVGLNTYSVEPTPGVSYYEVFGPPRTWSKDPGFTEILQVTEDGLQTNPPT